MKAAQRTSDEFQDAPSGGAAEGNPTELLEVFWRGRYLILLSIVVCMATAWFYLARTTPLYTSSSRIFVEASGPKIMPDSMGGVMDGTANYLATQTEVMRSAPVIAIAVENGSFSQMKTFAGLDNPAGLIKAGLEVEIGKNNDIISVSYTSPYPAESADVVNRVVNAYKTYISQQKRSTAADILKILQQEKDKREAELDKKLKEKLAFMKANSNLLFEADKNGEKASVAVQRMGSLTEALTAAQLATFDARANYEFAKAAVADPVKLRRLFAGKPIDGGIAMAGAPGAGATGESKLRDQIDDLQSQLDDLKQRYLPGFPAIQALEAKINRLNASLGAEPAMVKSPGGASVDELAKRFGEAYLATAEQRFEIAKFKEDELQKSFGASVDEQKRLAIDANNQAAIYAMMEADFRRTTNLCDALQVRINEIHVTEDTGAMNISVLEFAKPSPSPSKPDRSRVLGMALMLGIGLGLAFSFLASWMDHRIRSADEIQGILSLPILGAVATIEGTDSHTAHGQRVHIEPASDIAEAYRTIRTAIYFGVPDSKSKTLLVTSPQPGDGKSTTVSNLAIALAQAGQRTLILDADFRRPTQHKIFTVEPGTGLSGALAGKTTVAEAIKPTGIAKLDLLPCGPIPANPSEILNSQAFADLLVDICRSYDHVVLDSPPVMPVTDARILGAICDVTLLVLRAERSTRKVATFARDVLQSVGANILGVVVNGVPRGRGRYGNYYGYGYYNAYGYYGRDQKKTSGNGSHTNGEEKKQLVPESMAERLRT